MQKFSELLLTWFDSFGRKDLPWQQDISPYRVWISEIMLQQTQVQTAIPYFEKFLANFKTIKMLADAPLDYVLHLWTGLGYYARARNIHKTAKIICDQLNHQFPANLDSLLSLPGIGRSTAGAILSIAFQIPTPILDGNVKRVLSRYHAIDGYSSSRQVEVQLWRLASEYTPRNRCAHYTQAIMDLGATVCTRTKPNCQFCPLQSTCVAYREDKATHYPQQKPRPKIPVRSTSFLILRDKTGRVLLEKRFHAGIWGGLWAFPVYDRDDIELFCRSKFGCKIITKRAAEVFRHTFSHFHLDITPIYIDVENNGLLVSDASMLWCHPTALPKIGLAAPVKKLLTLF